MLWSMPTHWHCEIKDSFKKKKKKTVRTVRKTRFTCGVRVGAQGASLTKYCHAECLKLGQLSSKLPTAPNHEPATQRNQNANKIVFL